MSRYKKDDNVYYAPPEITRVLKHLKGAPKYRVIYDPRLEYAVGETKNYVKEHFLVMEKSMSIVLMRFWASHSAA